MFLPLNTGPSSVSGSAKSFSQPTLGQTSGWSRGTWQYFVYMASRDDVLHVDLEAELGELRHCRLADLLLLVALSETPVNVLPPSYLPDAKPAFFMYSIASSRSPSSLGQEVDAGARFAAGLLEARLARRDPVRRDLAGELAAERLAQRVAVERRGQRPADVGVVERLRAGVQRDVAEASGRRRRHELVLLVALRDAARGSGRGAGSRRTPPSSRRGSGATRPGRRCPP